MSSEVAEDFAALKSVRRAEKKENQSAARKIFKKYDVDFRELNGGLHLRVMDLVEAREFDFWPSSGRWIECGGNSEGHDIESLLVKAGYK